MSGPIRMCVDMPLPPDAVPAAEARALAERPDNLGVVPIPGAGRSLGRPRMAVRVDLCWRPGTEIAVRFLGGSAGVRRRVEEIAHRWEEHANIGFRFGRSRTAPLRIAFRRGGSWSYVGTAALSVPDPQPTMNLGWLTDEAPVDEYERVVLHEFGHALGCEHEHQSPGVRIPWDKPRVYAWYAETLGWPQAMVDEQVLFPHSPEGMRWSRFDPESIMLYPVDEALTVGSWSVGWNRVLSDADRAFIRTQYPAEPRLMVNLPVDAPVSASIGTVGELDRFRFVVSTPGRHVLETQGRTNVTMSLLGPNAETALLAADDDSGARYNARIERDLAPGAYLVHVRHQRAGGKGRYRLSLSRT